MPESADLLAAVAAAPADDLPRLIYADWLDDRGEPDHATFVRDQIRLAQVPSWDPLAVRARHQRKETLGIGRPFYGTLPELPLFLKWHPEKAFRRGFGTGVVVNQLSGLIEAGQQLFDLAPVDELWLGAASLDEWRTVARSPWLKHIRKVHLHFSQGLHEPIRCLAESPYSGNIDEIWFDTLATPAAGAVIEILAQSPLARQLTGLHMRLVHTPSLPEVIAALAEGKFERLKRFSIVQAGLEFMIIRYFSAIPFLFQLEYLDISQNPIMNVGLQYFGEYRVLLNCKELKLSECSIDFGIMRQPSRSVFFSANIHKIDCSKNRIGYRGLELYEYMIGKNLRCIDMNLGSFNSLSLKRLFKYKKINKVQELVLSENRVTNQCAKYICRHRYFNETCSIVFTKSTTDDDAAVQLESHFGDRLVWAAEDAATGLAR